LSYYNAYCTQSFSAVHTDLIKRFLASLLQAENYVIDNSGNAKAIIQKQLNVSNTVMSEIWSENRFTLSLDQSLVLSTEDEAQWLINNNQTNATTVPNVLSYIYTNGLESVKPGAVNIIG